MALVDSLTTIPVGTEMPVFELPTPDGRMVSHQSAMGNKGLLVVFTCNHCPYAIAIWPRLIQLAKEAKSQGIETVAINPNIHPNYPDDSAENMAKKISEWGISFPYLVDDTQDVARSFKAQCTPDLYLMDADYKLVYHGRLDDNWKAPDQVTRQELKTAIDALALGQPPIGTQYPSMGCSIKWKSV